MLLLSALPLALGQGLPDLGDVSQSEMSPQIERRLGESIMREIRADRTYSDDAEITDYLNALGYKLVAASADSRQEFNFFLIMDPQVNAFALPGGFVGINSGLILTAQSESELAGVVSHEVAHVTQRHMARMLSAQKQSQLTSLAALAVAVLAARANPEIAQAAIIASQAGTIQSALNYTRDHEREADRVGFQVLEKAGFDAQAMALFFERMQRATRFYESSAPAYLRTHPLTFERIADMQNRAQNLPYRQVPDSIEFQLMRAKIKAAQDKPQEALTFFEDSLGERKYLSEAASRYGLVAALLRVRAYARAGKELQTLRKALRSSRLNASVNGPKPISRTSRGPSRSCRNEPANIPATAKFSATDTASAIRKPFPGPVAPAVFASTVSLIAYSSAKSTSSCGIRST